MTPISDRSDHDHHPEAIRERLAEEPEASYLRDWVYGGIDGSVTTFAIVSGVVGAGLSPAVILILGVANLVADGFSMAAGNYSATRTEKQELETLRSVEERHIAQYPEGEREEVRQIYEKQGFRGEDLERMVEAMTANRNRWIDFMIAEEYGVARHIRSAKKAAAATFTAFLVCGVVPLLPFLLRMPNPFGASLVMTLAVFFGIGSVKSRVLTVSWWRAGLETLVIGAIAAAIAYVIGLLLGGIGRT
ncbi:MAG TPA: VIT1/CCC1 transporter family protein [Thermoanaerobaculia bacterium]|nr:VIT1/CCC1 transporter family protein [Thermoanaerobaculia bacterium]